MPRSFATYPSERAIRWNTGSRSPPPPPAGPFARSKDIVDWLKRDHRIGHVSAQLIARRFQDGTSVAAEHDPFAQSSNDVRSWVKLLSQTLLAEQPHVVVTPCKTYVGFGNPRQFAVMKPQGKDCLLLGLAGFDAASGDPASAKGLGGSNRIAFAAPVTTAHDIAAAKRHLLAAATAK